MATSQDLTNIVQKCANASAAARIYLDTGFLRWARELGAGSFDLVVTIFDPF
jgi:hypothetical protein